MLIVASLKGQCVEILCFRFFYESSLRKPLILPASANSIFKKSTKTFETQGAPHASMTPIANLKKFNTEDFPHFVEKRIG
jgi:hypothetical protein